jgi:hypothetical protein
MDWQRIRADWQSRSEPHAERALSAPSGLTRLWSRVRRRDRIETAVAIVMAPLFAAMAVWLFSEGLLVAAGFSAWLTLCCIYVPLRLRAARRLIPEPHPEQPVLEFLHAEREALRMQREMLASVWRWYWGPIAVGVVGFFVGIRGLDWVSAGYVALVVMVSLAIEVANRMAVRHQIEPALRVLDEQIDEIEDNDDMEDEQ